MWLDRCVWSSLYGLVPSLERVVKGYMLMWCKIEKKNPIYYCQVDKGLVMQSWYSRGHLGIRKGDKRKASSLFEDLWMSSLED